MIAKHSIHRVGRLIGLAASAAACALAAQAAAQVATDQPTLTIPAESRKPTTDIRVAKTAIGASFEITVANYGSEPVTGIIVTDRLDSGPACPATSPVNVSSGGVAEGRFTIADLTGAGIVLGTLSGDEVATLTFECKGN